MKSGYWLWVKAAVWHLAEIFYNMTEDQHIYVFNSSVWETHQVPTLEWSVSVHVCFVKCCLGGFGPYMCLYSLCATALFPYLQHSSGAACACVSFRFGIISTFSAHLHLSASIETSLNNFPHQQGIFGHRAESIPVTLSTRIPDKHTGRAHLEKLVVTTADRLDSGISAEKQLIKEQHCRLCLK